MLSFKKQNSYIASQVQYKKKQSSICIKRLKPNKFGVDENSLL